MLVLTRKPEQKIQISDSITITVLQVHGQTVRLGIEAPGHVPVLRQELVSRPPVPVERAASPTPRVDPQLQS